MSTVQPPAVAPSPPLASAFAGEVAVTREGVAAYILSTSDFTRRDRLWPAHYELFGTNPMSLAYGASGISMILKEITGSLPHEVVGWMLEQPLSTEKYPPGLYTGLAGIAYALEESGLRDPAESTLQKALTSPLLLADNGMLFGAAGWGLVCLHFYDVTGDDQYLEGAVRAGDHLVSQAIREDDGVTWIFAREGRPHLGYGFGASGISIFLLYLGLRTGIEKYLDYAREGLDFDLANGQETPNGISWARYKDDILTLPYWMHGGAGVGTAAIRFYRHLGEERYLRWAERIAEGAAIRWSVLPSLLEGLSGIGEFMLDMYSATGDEQYQSLTTEIAETVLLFRIPKPSGVAFPGRWLTRISNDYATGAAGIAQFLGRVLHPRPRRLVDLPSLTL